MASEVTTAQHNGGSTREETTKRFIDILQNNGITSPVAKVTLENAGLVGAGFASQSKYATITFEDESKPLNLFVKMLLKMNSEMHTQAIKATKWFEKESKFFMEYLPEAKILCEAYRFGDLMNIYPKCYYGGEDMIVLENLVLDQGFELLEKDDKQDMDAAKIALTSLAKHHAIAHTMMESYGGPEAFFEKFVNLDFDSFIQPFSRAMVGPMYDSGITAHIRLLENSTMEGTSEALEMMKTNMGKVYDHIVNVLTENIDDEPFLVLNHGDYWNNNMMFLKDKKTGKLIEHKTIDFQVTRYNSPAVDLGYYFFTSVKPSVRRDHLWDLLRFYLETLKQIGSDLGQIIELSEEDLFASFLKKYHLGFWSSVTFSSGPLSEVLKQMDMNNLENNKVSDFEAEFNQQIKEWIDKNPEKCVEMTKDIIGLVKEFQKLEQS